jgi:hypothetical protein
LAGAGLTGVLAFSAELRHGSFASVACGLAQVAVEVESLAGSAIANSALAGLTVARTRHCNSRVVDISNRESCQALVGKQHIASIATFARCLVLAVLASD